MLDALPEKIALIDEELGGFGVYASDLSTVWSKSLYPIVKDQGWTIGYTDPNRCICIHNQNGRTGRIEVNTFSAVKVRKYGGSYQVDTHTNNHDRWNPKSLQRGISRLWKEDSYDYHAFVFIGFDRSAFPFRRELANLDNRMDWTTHNVSNIRKHWPDSQHRQLSVMVSLWQTD